MERPNKIHNDPLAKEPKQNINKLLLGLTILAVISTIGLAGALWWSLTQREPQSSGGQAQVATPAGSGPCYNGATNALPPGYQWYENHNLGFTFAYPDSWGSVSIAESPMGGTDGHYLQGKFSGNDNVFFGGNGTDYTVNPRGGMPTDNPGYLQAANAFYTVQLWRLNDMQINSDEPQYALYPIDGEVTKKDGCNATAAVSQYPETEFTGYAYDIARFNLQPDNLYYGVNFVLRSPTSELRDDLDKIIRSFQLIK